MALRFHKMHGLGNDFVVVDARAQAVAMDAARARAIADRRTGIGCDQLILVEPSQLADVRMRIFNSDGSEVEVCGNAARCVATLIGGGRIETLGGVIEGEAIGASASIDMGTPRFGWDEIPLAYPLDTASLPVAWEGLETPFAVNVGNPHLVFFVADPAAVDLARLGPVIERDPLFPERINVGVARVADDGGIDLAVWERGAGLTRACGTGACAAAVAAVSRGLARGPIPVRLPGGTLEIDWTPGGTIRMRGPAAYVFSGETDL
jgi:diaminopimelate epimerase